MTKGLNLNASFQGAHHTATNTQQAHLMEATLQTVNGNIQQL